MSESHSVSHESQSSGEAGRSAGAGCSTVAQGGYPLPTAIVREREELKKTQAVGVAAITGPAGAAGAAGALGQQRVAGLNSPSLVAEGLATVPSGGEAAPVPVTVAVPMGGWRDRATDGRQFPLLRDSFAYPFRDNSKYILLVGGVGFAVMVLMGFTGRLSATEEIFGSGLLSYNMVESGPAWLLDLLVTLVCSGLMVGMLLQILMLTINQPERPAEWPEFDALWDDVYWPMLRVMLMAVVVWLLPQLLLEFWVNPARADIALGGLQGAETPLWFRLLAGLVGVASMVYLAFAVQTMTVLGTIRAAGPKWVWQSFSRSLPESWLLLLVFFLLLLVQMLLGLTGLLSPVLPKLIGFPLAVYTLMVVARFLGLLYREKQEEIGWL